MGIFTIGRLRPGVSAKQAQAELQTFFEERGRAYSFWDSNSCPVGGGQWSNRCGAI